MAQKVIQDWAVQDLGLGGLGAWGGLHLARLVRSSLEDFVLLFLRLMAVDQFIFLLYFIILK